MCLLQWNIAHTNVKMCQSARPKQGTKSNTKIGSTFQKTAWCKVSVHRWHSFLLNVRQRPCRRVCSLFFTLLGNVWNVGIDSSGLTSRLRLSTSSHIFGSRVHFLFFSPFLLARLEVGKEPEAVCPSSFHTIATLGETLVKWSRPLVELHCVRF